MVHALFVRLNYRAFSFFFFEEESKQDIFRWSLETTFLINFIVIVFLNERALLNFVFLNFYYDSCQNNWNYQKKMIKHL